MHSEEIKGAEKRENWQGIRERDDKLEKGAEDCMDTLKHIETYVLFAEVCEMTPFGRWESASKSKRNAGFDLTTRSPLILKVEPVSGYLNCLLEFEE